MRGLCDDMVSMNTFTVKNLEIQKRRTFIKVESVDVMSAQEDKIHQKSEMGSFCSHKNSRSKSSACISQAIEVLSISEDENMPNT